MSTSSGEDHASFRRFYGFAAREPTPERAAFVRLRAELVRRGLDRALFEAVARQFDRRGAVVRAGTSVGATLVPPGSHRRRSHIWSCCRCTQACPYSPRPR